MLHRLLPRKLRDDPSALAAVACLGIGVFATVISYFSSSTHPRLSFLSLCLVFVLAGAALRIYLRDPTEPSKPARELLKRIHRGELPGHASDELLTELLDKKLIEYRAIVTVIGGPAYLVTSSGLRKLEIK